MPPSPTLRDALTTALRDIHGGPMPWPGPRTSEQMAADILERLDLGSFIRVGAAGPVTPEAGPLRPARRGGKRRLTFDNGQHEDYEAVFVQHVVGEWDRILVARDDGTIADVLVALINGRAATPDRPEPRCEIAVEHTHGVTTLDGPHERRFEDPDRLAGGLDVERILISVAARAWDYAVDHMKDWKAHPDDDGCFQALEDALTELEGRTDIPFAGGSGS